MQKRINFTGWAEGPERETRMQSYSRHFPIFNMPSFTATGKSTRTTATGPAETMLAQMQAIHSGGSMRIVEPATKAEGWIIGLGSGATDVRGLRLGGLDVTSAVATWPGYGEAVSAALSATEKATGTGSSNANFYVSVLDSRYIEGGRLESVRITPRTGAIPGGRKYLLVRQQPEGGGADWTAWPQVGRSDAAVVQAAGEVGVWTFTDCRVEAGRPLALVAELDGENGEPGVGSRVRPRDADDQWSEVEWNGMAGQNVPELTLCYRGTAALSSGMSLASAGEVSMPVVTLTADTTGPQGNTIGLTLGKNPSGELVSGPTLDGGALSAGARARVEVSAGPPADSGLILYAGESLSLPYAPGANAQQAIGMIYHDHVGGTWDTEELTVEIGGVEVHGGGQGIVGNINAMHLGVTASAPSLMEGTIMLVADVAGEWGNRLEISAEHTGEAYAVAASPTLQGGADAGMRPAAAAWGWIGADGDAGLDWEDYGTMTVNGIAIVPEEGEALYQALNRYSLTGKLGNSGLIAEPRLMDEEGNYRMYLHACVPGAAGNDIVVGWVMTGPYAGHEANGPMREGADAEVDAARSVGEVLDAAAAFFDRLPSVRVEVADATGSGTLKVGGRTTYVGSGAACPASGYFIPVPDAAGASGTLKLVRGDEVLFEHEFAGQDHGWTIAEVKAALEADENWPCTILDEESEIDFEAPEVGPSWNDVELVLTGELFMDGGVYHDGMSGGRFDRELPELAALISQSCTLCTATVEGDGLRLRNKVAGDRTAYAYEVSGECFEPDIGELEGSDIELERLGGTSYALVARSEGSAGNSRRVYLSGCLASAAGEYALQGGADNVDRAASGWLRLPNAAARDIGLSVNGVKVVADHAGATAAEWAAAINAAGVGVTAAATTSTDYMMRFQALDGGDAGNGIAVGYVGGSSGGGVYKTLTGGKAAVQELEHSMADGPGDITLQPFDSNSKRGYCWQVTTTVTRRGGMVAEMETEWEEMYYTYPDEEKEEEETEEREKREEEEDDETLGESADNPEIETDTEAVLEPILTHPLAAHYSEEELAACHAYINGASLDSRIRVKGKEKTLRACWPKGALGELILHHVFEYRVPHTVARKEWTGQGGLHEVCTIGSASGLPAAGKNRNWMCVGAGKVRRGQEVVKHESWELSSPGGWNKTLYSGNQ